MSTTARVAQAKKTSFLTAFADLGTVTHAARAAGVPRRTVYDWLERDPQFALGFRAAEQEAIDSLEREARRRAIAGSDTLLIFLMKGANPAKYRERVDVMMDISKMVDGLTHDPEERAAALAEVDRILARR